MDYLNRIIGNELSDYKNILVKHKLNEISVKFANSGRVLNLVGQARNNINNITDLLTFLNIVLKCYVIRQLNKHVKYDGENLFIEQCLLAGDTKFLNKNIMKFNYVLNLPYVKAMAQNVSSKFMYDNASSSSERQYLAKIKKMISLINTAITNYLRRNFVITEDNKLSQVWDAISNKVPNFKHLLKINKEDNNLFGYVVFRRIYKLWRMKYKNNKITWDVYFRAVFIAINTIAEEMYCSSFRKKKTKRLNNTMIQPSYEILFIKLQNIDTELQKILCKK